MFTRRAVLRSLAAGALALGARPAFRIAPASAQGVKRSRPRFYIQVIPSGGMDAVWGADPKTRSDVEKSIDVPYDANKIIDAKVAHLAPGFAPLAKWMPRLAIVNAFRQNSANHPAGLVHATCCMNNATPGLPSMLELLGTRRDTEAVGAISLGAVWGSVMSPAYIGQPSTAAFGKNPGLFDHLDKADPGDVAALAKILKKRAASARRTSSAESTTADNIQTSAALLEKWAAAPTFTPATWTMKDEDYFHNAIDVQRALWLLENGISRCVTVNIGNNEFDTHVWNFWQPSSIQYLTNLLASMFTELDKRIVDGRPMSEQTVVFVGSEIGRFPKLNNARGKDHLPQAPYLFYGPWFRTGKVYGETDREMIAKSVSMKTGKPERGGRNLVLDDIGRTLLELDGANPEVFGYVGERLSFLLA
jgi:hypothetical protein